jgi:hypothetical protein
VERIATAASLAVLAAFTALLVASAAQPGYVDHAEPNIASVAWLALRGAPLYHALDASDRYSLLYGPGSYLPFSAALWLGGGAVPALKLLVLVANVASLSFLWLAYRQVLDRRRALLALACVVLLMLVPRPNHYLLQVRGDVLVVAAVTAGVFATAARSRPQTLALLVGSAAYALAAKASAFLYFGPLFVRLAARRGWAVALAGAAAAACLSLAPFLLPNVSLPFYLDWLRLGTTHPTTAADFVSSARTLALLLAPAPLLLAAGPWKVPALAAYLRQNRVPLAALGVCLAAVLAVSSKCGSGPHHLLPFVPVLGYEYVLLFRAMRESKSAARRTRIPVRLAWAGFAVVVAARVGGGIAEVGASWTSDGHAARAAIADLRSILARHPLERIEMGYGARHTPSTSLRPELVVASDRLTVDEAALTDMQLSGLPIPDATIDGLRSCATHLWLIPKGEPPFALPNVYGVFHPELVPSRPLFDRAFRDAFVEAYALYESTAYFDVWKCREAREARGPR